jgi:hypothetical protein
MATNEALAAATDAARRYGRLAVAVLWPPRDGCAPRSLRHYAVAVPVVALLPVYGAYQWLGLLFDEILFRGYRRVPVTAPLFIVGVARSGTTALHHALADDPQLTTMRAWECVLAPSITWRYLWRGLARLDRYIGRPGARAVQRLERRWLANLQAVHTSSLTAPEEDYLTLMPAFACFVLVVLAPDAGALWRLGRFDAALGDGERRRLMAAYRRRVQRHLYFHGPGRRLLAKNAAFTPALGSLMAAFPDARLMVCLHHPDAALGSQLAAVDGALTALHGPYRRRPFARRMLATFAFQYRHLLTLLPSALPGQAVLVPNGALAHDLAGTVERAYAELGLSVPAAYAEHLARRHRARSEPRARRERDLRAYGLDEDSVRAAFDPIHHCVDFEALTPTAAAELGPEVNRGEPVPEAA